MKYIATTAHLNPVQNYFAGNKPLPHDYDIVQSQDIHPILVDSTVANINPTLSKRLVFTGIFMNARHGIHN